MFPTYPSQKHTHSTNISFHSFTMQNTNPQKTSEPTEPMVPPPAKRLKSQPDPDQDQGLVHCPRCDSSRTKFCYYNNYSLSQPRYFCKSCRRYWTKGGTLRNIPVGGFSRKSKKIGSAAAYRRRCSELQPQAAALQYDKLPVVPNGNVISPSSSSLQLSYPESPFQLPENHDFIFEDLTIDFMERSGSGRDYESGNYFSTPMTTSGYGAVTGNIHGPGPFAETMSYYDAQYEKIINGDFDVKPKLFENGCYLGLHGSGAERDGSSGCPLGLGPSWAGLSSGFGCMSTNPPLV